MSNPFTISAVCTGNICRSPIAEAVIRDALERAGWADRVRVVSAATGEWNLGDDADRRALDVLRANGLDLVGHRARLFTPADFDDVDLVLALDSSHVRALRSLARTPAAAVKIRMLRSFDPEAVAAGDLDVVDPYYGDRRDFDVTYAHVMAAVPGVLDHVRTRLAE